MGADFLFLEEEDYKSVKKKKAQLNVSKIKHSSHTVPGFQIEFRNDTFTICNGEPYVTTKELLGLHTIEGT